VPLTGPQAVASVTVAGLDADIARGYENGVGLAQSNGETDGTGFGASLRLGWAFALTERVTVTPFGDYQATRVELDGYTETDGPFPAMIGAIDDTAQIARLGIEGRYALSDLSWLWAAAAWGHRLDGNSAAIDAQLIGLFGVSGASFALDDNWAELTGGISYGLDDRSRLTASATAFVAGEDSTAATGRIGYSRAF
jgi:outer membrane autotransporter protein